MAIDHDEQVPLGIDAGLSELASHERVQSNCMFQLALMVARIAVEPCPEGYKAEAAQALMDLIRAKPKGNVVRLFGDKPKVETGVSGLRAAG